MPHLYRFKASPAVIAGLDSALLRRLRDGLEATRCTDRREEARVLISVLREGALDPRELRRIRSRLLTVLRKFAYRKYEREFEEIADEIDEATHTDPHAFDGGLAQGVAELRDLAWRRFQG
jgi:hypothetical protein